jgi:HK97 family phage prohead protease
MPIPKPNKDEQRQDFINRCMGNDVMVSDYPNNDQRMAVCSVIWRNNHKKMNTSIKFKAIEDVTITPEGNDFVIEGYASVFGVKDMGGDIVVKGAFTKTLQEMNGRITLCYQHSLDNPIGKMLELREDEHGLYFKSRISDAEDDIKQKIKEGILKEFSIGYSTIIEEENMINGEKVCYLKEVKLWEISLVTLAMNSDCVLTGISAIKGLFGVDTIEEEFDRLIITEKNQNKKFELMKLKNIALMLTVPDNTTQQQEPQEILISDQEYKYLSNILKLI